MARDRDCNCITFTFTLSTRWPFCLVRIFPDQKKFFSPAPQIYLPTHQRSPTVKLTITNVTRISNGADMTSILTTKTPEVSDSSAAHTPTSTPEKTHAADPFSDSAVVPDPWVRTSPPMVEVAEHDADDLLHEANKSSIPITPDANKALPATTIAPTNSRMSSEDFNPVEPVMPATADFGIPTPRETQSTRPLPVFDPAEVRSTFPADLPPRTAPKQGFFARMFTRRSKETDDIEPGASNHVSPQKKPWDLIASRVVFWFGCAFLFAVFIYMIVWMLSGLLHQDPVLDGTGNGQSH